MGCLGELHSTKFDSTPPFFVQTHHSAPFHSTKISAQHHKKPGAPQEVLHQNVELLELEYYPPATDYTLPIPFRIEKVNIPTTQRCMLPTTASSLPPPPPPARPRPRLPSQLPGAREAGAHCRLGSPPQLHGACGAGAHCRHRP